MLAHLNRYNTILENSRYFNEPSKFLIIIKLYLLSLLINKDYYFILIYLDPIRKKFQSIVKIDCLIFVIHDDFP